jgi:putative ABC transport system permease protein
MIKNLLLVALRNFKRDKWYSLLNILGLTIGITFGLLLIFYIKDELNYDRYNNKADRICRVVSYIQEPEKPVLKWAITQFPLAPVLKKDYPEVEESVRLVGSDKTMYKNEYGLSGAPFHGADAIPGGKILWQKSKRGWESPAKR